VQFPMGVGFAAAEGDADHDNITDMAMAAYGKLASAADYQALIESRTPLPGLIERNKRPLPTASTSSEGAKRCSGKPGGVKNTVSPNGGKWGPKRPFMPTWRCAHLVDGKRCGHFNFYYLTAKPSDTEVAKVCRKCAVDKKVADGDKKPGGRDSEAGMAALQFNELECVLFIGTQFSNLYTAVDTPARGRVVLYC
jgi:hypothetical protein